MLSSQFDVIQEGVFTYRRRRRYGYGISSFIDKWSHDSLIVIDEMPIHLETFVLK